MYGKGQNLQYSGVITKFLENISKGIPIEINEDGTISFETTHFSKYALMEYTKSFDDITSHWAKDDIEVI